MSAELRHKVLYEQWELPIYQNRMYATAAEAIACPKGDVRLVEDLRSGLIYNVAFRSEMMVYDASYQNEQGLSPLFREHLEAVGDIVLGRMGASGLVEVGCGKGLFLEMMLARGVDIVGFDPAYEGANPRVMRQYFAPGLDIRAEGLLIRHVLEHVENPYAFLRALRTANHGGGLVYIEVPSFNWICDRRAWFDVFYEHVNYFRLSDFYRLFGNVIEGGRLFGGQYLYVVADLGTLRAPKYDPADRAQWPDDFTDSLHISPGPGRVGAIWGGASKGVIFATLKAREGHPLETVIDINPAKQGKYLPATGLLVQSPQQALPRLSAGSSIYVMNSNYLEEIRAMSNNAYDYIVIDRE